MSKWENSLAGHLNLVADALSRLDIEEDKFDNFSTGSQSKPLLYEEEKWRLMIAKRLDLLPVFPLASERTLEKKSVPIAPKTFHEYQQAAEDFKKGTATKRIRL